MPRIEERYANDVRQAMKASRAGWSWLFLLVIVVMLAGGGFWAANAHIGEVVRGQGRFIAAQENQLVQSLYPGVVSSIHVREGDQVSIGQDLISIDDTSALSELGEVRERIAALDVRKMRLMAEVNGTILDYSKRPDLPKLLCSEEFALYKVRQDALKQELAVANQQLAQRQIEKVENETKLREIEGTIELSNRELTLARDLNKTGSIPELQLIRLERQALSETREKAVLQASSPRILAAISEAKAKVSAVTSNYMARAREELAKVMGERNVLKESIIRLEAKVARTILKSPTNGIVNRMQIKSVGAVVQQGAVLVEIVPSDDNLLVQARVSPRDIAFIHPGQDARVKVTAYDYTIYGDLPARLERISADTVTDKEGQTYYQVIISVSKDDFGGKTKNLPIIPGMVASVDILTGSKTVMDYLLKPIKKAQWEALRER
ncbi:HlyD family type I secretion periplasmic adaptor subunit [uncultured Cohaesibacter sp.]|uniref:HlyD family type I secretion periplasmic adaptor subunit n=1 Tax=uncultured Cohaesibacter sp. TaxID=1002546 RepID=UPI00292E727B|nr:HlyD family type I secretion periplasmic adaptor subunit [uncultured Cohaesibacter sp.]